MNAGEKDRPFDALHSTKQADMSHQFENEKHFQTIMTPCVLACPAGGASGRA